MLNSVSSQKGEKKLSQCMFMSMEDLENLETVPPEEMTYRICEIAVNRCGKNLKYVPEKYMSLKLCIDAINNDGKSLEFVPHDFIDFDLCEQAIKNNIEAYEFIPEELKDNPIFRKMKEDA